MDKKTFISTTTMVRSKNKILIIRFFLCIWFYNFFVLGVSGYLVWKKGGFMKQSKSFISFTLHLLFFFMWAPIAFDLKMMGHALIVCILRWLSLLFTIYHFYKQDERTVIVLLPTVIFETFQVGLNYVLWEFNI